MFNNIRFIITFPLMHGKRSIILYICPRYYSRRSVRGAAAALHKLAADFNGAALDAALVQCRKYLYDVRVHKKFLVVSMRNQSSVFFNRKGRNGFRKARNEVIMNHVFAPFAFFFVSFAVKKSAT